jgi:hypothetical protein
MRCVTCLIGVVVLAGCGSGGADGGDGDYVAVLVGTWTSVGPDSGYKETFAFQGDRSFTYDKVNQTVTDGSLDEHVKGTYSVPGGILALDYTSNRDPVRARDAASIYADAKTLLTGALLPQGRFTGPVGTWLGTSRFDWLDPTSGKVTATQLSIFGLDLRADQSYTAFVTVNGAPSPEQAGTWAVGPAADPVGPTIVLTPAGRDPVSVYYASGNAIGTGVVYQR